MLWKVCSTEIPPQELKVSAETHHQGDRQRNKPKLKKKSNTVLIHQLPIKKRLDFPAECNREPPLSLSLSKADSEGS